MSFSTVPSSATAPPSSPPCPASMMIVGLSYLDILSVVTVLISFADTKESKNITKIIITIFVFFTKSPHKCIWEKFCIYYFTLLYIILQEKNKAHRLSVRFTGLIQEITSYLRFLRQSFLLFSRCLRLFQILQSL